MSKTLSSSKTAGIFLALFWLIAAFEHASGQPSLVHATQATPSGFELPRASGTLTYSVALSEGVTLGYNGSGGTAASTNISGHLGFLSTSVRQPFSLVYSGGYLSGAGQPSSFVQNLAVSQVLHFHRFNVVVADQISYLPNNPVSGLSGVAGLGDQGIAPLGQNDGTQLLSQYGPRITNAASGSVGYSFSGRTSLSLSGTDTILRTTGTVGVENNTESGNLGLSHRLDELSSVSVNGFYSHYSYLAYPLVYDSYGSTVEYTRQWNRRLTTNLSIGPEYSTSTASPSTLNYSLNASANYQIERVNASASVVHATNSGSGVSLASRSTSANVSLNRQLRNYTSIAGSLALSQSTQLPSLLAPQISTNTFVTALQISHSLSRTLSAFASYTLQHQIPGQSSFNVSALSGTTQSLGFGLTYAPRPYILGK